MNYVDVGGVSTYYEVEVEGEGDPLILLHGGLVTIETWSAQRAALAERFRVHLPERPGHGRTADVDGPTSYVQMARETQAFMAAVGIDSAHLVGWSDGGNVALELALGWPELVRKMVLIGAAAHVDGATADSAEWVQSVTADSLPPFIREPYERLSPDGAEHFPVVVDKIVALWRTEPRHEMAELGAIMAPTLVMIADDDGVTVEHADAMRRAIPSAQLAVVPGATHGLMFEKPEVVNRLILDFLA